MRGDQRYPKNPVFDGKKLDWINQQYIQNLSEDQLVSRLIENVFSEAYLKKIAPLVKERLNRFDEFVDKNNFFFVGKLKYDDMVILPKGREASEFKGFLQKVLDAFDVVDQWDAEAINGCLVSVKEDLGWKPKEVFMPMRLITTGRKDSPPLAETLEVLGKEIVRFRVRDFMNSL